MSGVRLLVPIKPLGLAKSRLRGFSADEADHAELVLALALDTITAARDASGVAQVVAVTSDARVAAELVLLGVESVEEGPRTGLNEALRHAAALRNGDPALRLAALQGDLPALRADELSVALSAAGEHRAFCPDRQGTGTTLLLAEPGAELDPRFGSDSARAHERSSALPLIGPWPGLRCDVDTPDDLQLACGLGVGPHTTRLLAARSR